VSANAEEAMKSFENAVKSGLGKSPGQILLENTQLVSARCYFDGCNNVTALHIAAWYCKTGLVKQLIDLGSAVDARDDAGRTALHYVAGVYGYSKEQNRVLEYLISKGADVNAKTKSGETPLHYAAAAGSNHLIQLLLESGADHKVKDLGGRTPAKAFRGGEHVILAIIREHSKKTKKWWEFWK
jgi:hypothetical protein